METGLHTNPQSTTTLEVRVNEKVENWVVLTLEMSKKDLSPFGSSLIFVKGLVRKYSPTFLIAPENWEMDSDGSDKRIRVVCERSSQAEVQALLSSFAQVSVELLETSAWNKATFESCLLFRIITFLTDLSTDAKWIYLRGNTLLLSLFAEGHRINHPSSKGSKFMLVTLSAQACLHSSEMLDSVLLRTKVSRCFFRTCHLNDFLDSPCLEKVFASKGMIEAERLEISKCLVLPNLTEATLVEISRAPPFRGNLRQPKDFVNFWKDKYGYLLPEGETAPFVTVSFFPHRDRPMTYPLSCVTHMTPSIIKGSSTDQAFVKGTADFLCTTLRPLSILKIQFSSLKIAGSTQTDPLFTTEGKAEFVTAALAVGPITPKPPASSTKTFIKPEFMSGAPRMKKNPASSAELSAPKEQRVYLVPQFTSKSKSRPSLPAAPQKDVQVVPSNGFSLAPIRVAVQTPSPPLAQEVPSLSTKPVPNPKSAAAPRLKEKEKEKPKKGRSKEAKEPKEAKGRALAGQDALAVPQAEELSTQKVVPRKKIPLPAFVSEAVVPTGEGPVDDKLDFFSVGLSQLSATSHEVPTTPNLDQSAAVAAAAVQKPKKRRLA